MALPISLAASSLSLLVPTLAPARPGTSLRPAAAAMWRRYGCRMEADSDTRPEEMIFADADTAFKLLDVDSDGSISDTELRGFLAKKEYPEDLVDKIFTGIDVDKGGSIDGDELRKAFVKYPTLRQAFAVEERSVWPAMDDGRSEEEIFAIADKVFDVSRSQPLTPSHPATADGSAACGSWWTSTPTASSPTRN